MRKRNLSTSACSGLAILAGSLTFMGSAQAATIFSEDFEGASNLFGASTYNYAQNYTMPNLLTPSGGLKYMNGGAGTTGLASTNHFSAGTLSLLSGGITGAQIDGGQISYNLYSQFSTYRFQGDYATLYLIFLDGSSSPLGGPISLGGAAFFSALGSGNNGSYPDARDWGADSKLGIVPAGARFFSVTIDEFKVPTGTAIDGYIDNINVAMGIVPEPAMASLLVLGGGLFALRRRLR